MKILLVEDERRIAKNIENLLAPQGFNVAIEATGKGALFTAENEKFDVIVLDWMLPDVDGLEVCKKLRARQITTPILMLTAKSQVEDKVLGLTSGADDYLTKPFASQELIARIQALLRRGSTGTASPILKLSDLEVNMNTREVSRAGKLLNLSPKEYLLLECLCLNKGKAMDRMELLESVWGDSIDTFSNTVDVHINYLRGKIDKGKKLKLIRTVKGKGYMVCSE